jgi:hypothetical protein
MGLQYFRSVGAQSILRTVAERQRRENIVAHSVGPTAQTVGTSIIKIISPSGAL